MAGVTTVVRVVLVAAKPPPHGGLARWTETVLREGAARGKCEMRVIDMSPRWRSVEELRSWKRFILGSIHAARASLKLISLCFVFRPEIIHIATPGSFAHLRDAMMMIAAKLLRIPTVLHIHHGRLPAVRAGAGLEWSLFAAIALLAEQVIFLDAASEVATRRNMRTATAVIPNGIEDTGKSRNRGARAATSSEKIILYLGWVIPSKGMDELVLAWRLVARDDWRLEIVGPGSSDYKRALKEKCLGVKVSIRDEVPFDDAEILMRACEIFILPSHTEGFPYSLLEAMLCRKAIIATTVGAIPEMLYSSTEPCGILVSPKDHIAIAAACKVLMENESKRREIAENACRRARTTFLARDTFRQLRKIWEKLIERNHC